MGAKQRKRAEARDAQKAARREAIRQEHGVVKEPSQPTPLGRAMFLSRADAKRFFSSAGAKQRGFVQSDPSTWNPKSEIPKPLRGRFALPTTPPASKERK